MKAVTDIETGGFSKEKNGLCEIGMIAIDDNNIEVDSLNVLIKPYKRARAIQEYRDELVTYKDDAMAVNGITIEQLLNDGIEPEEACSMIVDFIKKNGITSFIGHNIEAFDKKWLLYFFSRFSEYDFKELLEVECTMKISKDKLELDSYSLSYLCNHFGIINEDAHRAVGDCRATLEVYRMLIK
ncbi:MAG: DNA polymerase-3 subunit epsilon [Enterobacterales bacterium]|jgi:DNA polymerase-3 subunit epsilon